MQLSSQPQPFDVPNNLLAKKLSSVNSKLDAFSRELGEESTLNILINTPITTKNKKVMGDYLSETMQQMITVQHRLSILMTKVAGINNTLVQYQDNEQVTVANINQEISRKRSLQQLTNFSPPCLIKAL
jgi:hypothetical protein